MADTSADVEPIAPRVVEYDRVTGADMHGPPHSSASSRGRHLSSPPSRHAAGVPSEFNEFLPKDSDEFKRWKAAAAAPPDAAAATGALEGLSLEGDALAAPAVVEKKLPGGKTKKLVPQASPLHHAAPRRTLPWSSPSLSSDPCAFHIPPPPHTRTCTHTHTQVVLERNTRQKKKCVTTVSGLEMFGVKLSEASKLFGKKFASGASIVKTAEGKEQIDVQASAVERAAGLCCAVRSGG